MQKTINVNLAGRIFYVEEDAYAVLDQYLQEVKHHFSKFEDSIEILADIEARVAEQLLEINKDGSNIVQKAAVDQVIQSMGKPSDFTDAEDGLKEKHSHQQHSTGQKRLYRNGDDHILGGVASGIASYFDTDPLWIRILFVMSTFLGGYGILIYIVLWIIIPEATTPSEKLEMGGNKITLESLEKSIKEKIIHNPKTKQGAKQVAEAFRPAAGKVRGGVSWLVQTLLRLVGLAFSVAGAVGIAGLIIGGTAFVTGSTSAYTQFPFRDFLGLPQFYAVLCAAFFIAFVPLLFLLLVGTSLTTLRSHFSRPTIITLVVLWVTAAAVAAGLAAYNAPRFENYIQTQPAYQTKTTTRNIGSFQKVTIKNGLRVELVQADVPNLTVEAVQEDQDRMHTTTDNDTLIIAEEGRKNRGWCFFCMRPRPRVMLAVPNLTEIRLENGARLENSEFKIDILKITAQNGSGATLENISGNVLELNGSNASSLNVAGNIRELTVQAQNASVIHAGTLRADTVKASAENASRITVQAVQSLEAQAQNSSRIYYQGTPLKINGTASPAPDTNRALTGESDTDEVVPVLPTPQPPLPAPAPQR